MAIFPGVNAANDYARRVRDGKILACKWVRLACERHLNDLEEAKGAAFPYRFDRAKAERVCKYKQMLPHVKGAKAGQDIALQPWQLFIECNKYGWVRKSDGRRRFRTSYVEVPRKNGKSTLSASDMLFMATHDGEGGAECYSAATTRDQAKIVFGVAQAMARKRPKLRQSACVVVRADAIHVAKTDAVCKPVSSEANNLDGLNPHFASIDELHAHRTRAVFDVIKDGMGAREQPLISVITTAGTDIKGVCYEQREYLTRILEGVFEDETFFGIIYTIDDGDDWTGEEALRKANPNYGVAIDPEYLKNAQTKARRSPQSQINFKTKHLNIWCKADTAWMDMRKWKACADPSLKIIDFFGMPCHIGLDLASKKDVAAKARLFERDGVYYYFGQYYLPEDAVEERAHDAMAHYAAWAEEGRFTLAPGNVIDYDEIKEGILADAKAFRVVDVGYDPWQATQLAQDLAKERIEMTEVRQTVQNLSEPMKQLEALVLSGKFRHNGCPVMTWMVSNVVAHVDKKENIWPNKDRPENKIDGVVALLIALARALYGDGAPDPSVYETRGIRTL
ncbi:MAG: terminase TerL endonuclease subunit [Rickettsiales bacterium]